RAENMAATLNEHLADLTGTAAAFFVPGPIRGSAKAGHLLANPKLLKGGAEAMVKRPDFWGKVGQGARSGAGAGAAYAAITPPAVPLPEDGDFAKQWLTNAVIETTVGAGFGAGGAMVSEAVPAAFYRRHRMKPEEF